MIKNYSLFLVFLIFLINNANFISAEIIPIKKPSQTKEEKELKLLVDVLKPLPKPQIKKETKPKKEKKLMFDVL